MSNFLFAPLAGFKDEIKKIFDKKLLFVVLQAAALVVGVILGIAIEPTRFIRDYYKTNAENYYALIMFSNSSGFSLLLERITVNLGYFAVFFALGMSVFLFPVSMLITAYRGFVLSLTIGIFGAEFGMTGVLIACFVLVPQNLIVTVCLALLPVIPIGCKSAGGIKCFVRRYAVCAAILYLVSLAGALVEALILCLLLRPMNFYF